MVTINGPQQNANYQNNNMNNQGRGNRQQRQDTRNRNDRNTTQRNNSNPVTECGFCHIIQGKNVPQKYISMGFNERHQIINERSIFPNNCLSWMMLSIDERNRVLADNDLYCKFCLRYLRAGHTSNTCGMGKHSPNTGFNGMCSYRDCDRHVTLCKKHESENRKKHKIYRLSLEWANSFKPKNEQTSLLMLKAKESESR